MFDILTIDSSLKNSRRLVTYPAKKALKNRIEKMRYKH